MVQLVRQPPSRDHTNFAAGLATVGAHNRNVDLAPHHPRTFARNLAPEPAQTLAGIASVEITALKTEEIIALSQPTPNFEDAGSLRRHYRDKGLLALPPSARPEFFTPDKIERTSTIVKQMCRELGIPDINYKLQLCFVDVAQPSGTSLRVPSHILSTFEYKGETYGGPFLGSVLGNTLQARGRHLDEGYRTRIVKESLELTVHRFDLRMVTIAIPQPGDLTPASDPTFEKRGEWLRRSRSTAILAEACGATPFQYVLDLRGIPLSLEVTQAPGHQIFFAMDASLRPLAVGRKELHDREFLRAMLVVDSARSSRAGKPSASANRGAQDAAALAQQDLFIKAFFSLGEIQS